MKRLLRKFGHGGDSLQNGDLPHHVGWLEALVADEEENVGNTRGPKQKRLEMVQDAIDLLNRASDMGNE